MIMDDMNWIKERCDAFDIPIRLGPFESGVRDITKNSFGMPESPMETWVEVGDQGKRFEYADNAMKYIDYLIHLKQKETDEEDEEENEESDE